MFSYGVRCIIKLRNFLSSVFYFLPHLLDFFLCLLNFLFHFLPSLLNFLFYFLLNFLFYFTNLLDFRSPFNFLPKLSKFLPSINSSSSKLTFQTTLISTSSSPIYRLKLCPGLVLLPQASSNLHQLLHWPQSIFYHLSIHMWSFCTYFYVLFAHWIFESNICQSACFSQSHDTTCKSAYVHWLVSMIFWSPHIPCISLYLLLFFRQERYNNNYNSLRSEDWRKKCWGVSSLLLWYHPNLHFVCVYSACIKFNDTLHSCVVGGPWGDTRVIIIAKLAIQQKW